MLDRNVGLLRLYQVTSGSWGSPLDQDTVTINDSTPYVIKAVVKQNEISCYIVGQSVSIVNYPSSLLAPGYVGCYSDKTGVDFDDVKVDTATARDPQTPRTGGLAATSLSSNQLLVESDGDTHRGGDP